MTGRGSITGSILMTGSAALRAAAACAEDDQRGELRRHFPSFFRDTEWLRELELQEASAERAKAFARAFAPCLYCREIGGAGVLGALWQLGEALECGLETDIRKIPIRQETVEICEYFDMDPYYSDTGAALLIASGEGHALCEALRREGIPAAIIGVTTSSRARTVQYPGHLRYLDRFAAP